jgi:hypothetical protein
MPHFTLTLDASGPVVNAGIGVSEGRRQALTAANEPIPTVQSVRALIDTGASFTSIDPAVMIALGLTPTGSVDMVTPSTGQGVHTADTYDVDFQIFAAATEPPLLISNLRVASCDLFLRQGIHMLIGRDILTRCIFMYNGTINFFSLSF